MYPDGTSPSGKAAGFGPAISEVRILPSQPIKRLSFESLFYIYKNFSVINNFLLVLLLEQLVMPKLSKLHQLQMYIPNDNLCYRLLKMHIYL